MGDRFFRPGLLVFVLNQYLFNKIATGPFNKGFWWTDLMTFFEWFLILDVNGWLGY